MYAGIVEPPGDYSIASADKGIADVERIIVRAAVGQRSTDGQAAAAAAVIERGVDQHIAIAGDASPPVVVTDAPADRRKSPETVLRPVSALFVVSLPASAITALAPFRLTNPSDRADLTAGEFQQRVGETNCPGRDPDCTEAGCPGDVQCRLDGTVPRDLDVAVVDESLCSDRVAGADKGVADVERVAVGTVVGQRATDLQAAAAAAIIKRGVDEYHRHCR